MVSMGLSGYRLSSSIQTMFIELLLNARHWTEDQGPGSEQNSALSPVGDMEGRGLLGSEKCRILQEHGGAT